MQLVSYEEIKILSPTIKINKYIIELILPKCNLIFGKTFSSVYLQLLLNTNNDPNSPNWKKNKCWLGVETIAKNINCGARTVHEILRSMEKIGLIEKSYHGKLYMFALKNNKIDNIFEIEELDINNEKNLLSIIEGKNIEKMKIKFLEINNEYVETPMRNYQFKDLGLLRQWITSYEQIQHGSSLMFVMFFANNLINSNLNEIEVPGLSEKQRAIKLGCSQSTISRYLNSFIKTNFIKTIMDSNNMSNKIMINKELLLMSEVSITENKKEKFKCPVCDKEIDSVKKLNLHITRCKDELHVMFKDIQEENDAYTIEKITEICKLNKNRFEDIKNEKLDKIKKINNLSLQLVKYYYGITETRCPSWGKETNLLKSHLNNNLAPDEIMEVLRYMAKRGYEDLRFFNNSINEALMVRQCKLDCKKEGTDAFLVRFYYLGMKQGLTDRLMLQGIKKITELKSNNYTYLQIKTVIEYMIDKRCPNFNFIVVTANEALTKSKDKNEMTKAYTTEELISVALDGVLEYGLIMMKDNNYDIIKKEIVMKLKDDICAGRVELTRVNKIYHKFAIALANEIYKRQMYDVNFTSQQWISKVELNKVNLELINY